VIRLLRGLRARLRDVVLRRTVERDMDEELRFHLEMETEKNLRAGMDPVEARRRARVAFGGVERHRETLREGRRLPVVESLWEDVRFALRSIARNPGLSAVAALTVGLGVGATTTVFSVGNALLLRPPPVPGGERLVTIQERRSGMVSTGLEGMRIPWARFEAYRDATRDIFEGLAAHRLDDFSLRLPEETLHVAGALTSGDYFQALGLRLHRGRSYASAVAAEAVISHHLWATRFGGDPDVVGRTVGVDGRTVTIVGVAPPGFRGVTIQADDLWVPMGVREAEPTSWETMVVPLGRLASGVGTDRAAEAVDATARRLPPGDGSTVRGATLEREGRIPSAVRTPVTGFLGILLGMALLVLLIAAANIAGAMIARSLARRREMAVRQAIGAGRGRLVRHLLAESLLVFAAGGGAGVGLAWLGTTWLARLPMPPQVSASLDVSPDGRVLAFGIGLTVLTGLVFGLVPALRGSRPELASELRSGGAGALGGEGRLRGAFVAGQVGLAVLLLLTATLFGRSLQKGLQADLGFDPEGVVVASVDLGLPLDYGREEGRAFYRALLDRVGALPSVEAVALSQYVPMAWDGSGFMASRPDAPDVEGVHVSYSSVDPGYFDALGVELVAGRGFVAGDDEGAGRVVVINEVLARRLWPGESPVGHRIGGFGDADLEVVGVVRTGRYSFVTEEPTPFVFFPLAQIYRHAMGVLARAPGAEAATLRGLREVVRSLDPDVALQAPATLDRMIESGLMPQRLAAGLIGAFGLVGLALAAMGIYGVLAYHVARRTRELAVRRALGARGRDVVGAVVGRGGLLAAAGCAAGWLGGAALAPVIGRFLFGIRPLDPVTFVAVPAGLLAVALIASLVPALRAGAVEPAVALRED
jgi:predicted permease